MCVDEYDRGAFKLFVIEATASYHLGFNFESNLGVRLCVRVCFRQSLSALKSPFPQVLPR